MFTVQIIVPKIFSHHLISSILNVPGESTLRRDFQRLQQENKERSEAHKRQQAQLAAQRRDPEEHKRQLLHDRQKRIEEQKEQRRRLEEVWSTRDLMEGIWHYKKYIYMLSSLDDKNDATLIYVCNRYEIRARRPRRIIFLRFVWRLEAGGNG